MTRGATPFLRSSAKTRSERYSTQTRYSDERSILNCRCEAAPVGHFPASTSRERVCKRQIVRRERFKGSKGYPFPSHLHNVAANLYGGRKLVNKKIKKSHREHQVAEGSKPPESGRSSTPSETACCDHILKRLPWGRCPSKRWIRDIPQTRTQIRDPILSRVSFLATHATVPSRPAIRSSTR